MYCCTTIIIIIIIIIAGQNGNSTTIGQRDTPESLHGSATLLACQHDTGRHVGRTISCFGYLVHREKFLSNKVLRQSWRYNKSSQQRPRSVSIRSKQNSSTIHLTKPHAVLNIYGFEKTLIHDNSLYTVSQKKTCNLFFALCWLNINRFQ